MRLANLAGRAVLLVDGKAVDLARASGGQFGPDPQSIYEEFDELRRWASQADLSAGVDFDPADLDSPAPRPGQLFGIGLNYRQHAEEAGYGLPSVPAVFGFFASSLSGPVAEVELPDGDVDWEVELVVVIGKRAHKIGKDSAWSHVAGLTVGQDISERRLQTAGQQPQAGLAKSYPGFTPMGPCLVTADEIGDPDDLELSCSIDGELMQHGRTSDLLFSVPELIEYLASVLPLEPGDVIFTGTPAGVGLGRKPPRYLRPGQTLTSSIEGIGELSQTFVEARD